MNKRTGYFAPLLGILCGILLAIQYINPYSGTITLSELVLQLSGTRGNIRFSPTYTQLLSLGMRQLPYYLFEFYFGIALYRHFCTASVYIFSRTPDRLRWYYKEAGHLFFTVLLYEGILLSASVFTSFIRFAVRIDLIGIRLLFTHFFLYGFWLFAMTLFINLSAIFLSSELSFALLLGGQSVCLASLAVLEPLAGSRALCSFVMNINPFSHLIIGWQSTALPLLTETPLPAVHFPVSAAYMLLLACTSVFLMAWLIRKKDIIIADFEFGGV